MSIVVVKTPTRSVVVSETRGPAGAGVAFPNPLLKQATWAIDGANSTGVASDLNPGTALLPLATWAELTRRIPDWTGLATVVTITNLSDVPTTDAWHLRGDLSTGGAIVVAGTRVTAKAGTLSARVTKASATDIPNQATDSLAASWAAYAGLNYYLRITSGANTGIIAPILKDLGSGAARLGEWIQPSASTPTFAGNGFTILGTETYEVYRPAFMPCISGTLDGPNQGNLTLGAQLLIHDCGFRPSGDGVSTFWQTAIGGSAAVAFFDCCITRGTMILRSLHQSWINGQIGAGSTGGFLYFNNAYDAYILAGATHNVGQWLIQNTVFTYIDQGHIQQGTQTTGYVQCGSALYIGDLGCFDNDFTSIWVTANSIVQFGHIYGDGVLWGSGNTQPLLDIDSWGQGQYVAGYTFPVTTSGSPFTLNGKTSVAVLRSDTGAFLAARNCTFTNLLASYAAGGFAGSVVDFTSQSSFVTA